MTEPQTLLCSGWTTAADPRLELRHEVVLAGRGEWATQTRVRSETGDRLVRVVIHDSLPSAAREWRRRSGEPSGPLEHIGDALHSVLRRALDHVHA